jgi:hypothetical protein
MDDQKISISQLWKEFKALPLNQRLKFIFPYSVVNKEQIRFLFRVETNNIITVRELDNKKVWLGKPKKDTVFKQNNTYILKDYLALQNSTDNDLKIEVIK